MREGPDDEAIEAFGRAAYCDPEGAKGWVEDGQCLPQVRTRGSAGSPHKHTLRQTVRALRSTDGSAPLTVAITAQEGISNPPTPVAVG